jgi:hypothetical protein
VIIVPSEKQAFTHRVWPIPCGNGGKQFAKMRESFADTGIGARAWASEVRAKKSGRGVPDRQDT